MKQMLGWLWMVGTIGVLLLIQSFRQNEPLVSFDNVLNGARGLIPLGIAITIIGAGLALGAGIHGLVFDSTRMQPGKISGRVASPAANPTASAGWRINYFRGLLLWGVSFEEESGFAELKRSWRTGEWLRDHRMLRGTLVLIGLPVALVGVFGTVALATDVTAVRLLLLLGIAYAALRLGFALIRA